MESNKSAEEICKLMVEECPFVIRPSIEPYIIEAMKLYASQFQSRIAQLENELAQYKSGKIVTSLMDEVDTVEKQNNKLREALEKINNKQLLDWNRNTKSEYEKGYNSSLVTCREIAERALNSKEVGNA